MTLHSRSILAEGSEMSASRSAMMMLVVAFSCPRLRTTADRRIAGEACRGLVAAYPPDASIGWRPLPTASFERRSRSSLRGEHGSRAFSKRPTTRSSRSSTLAPLRCRVDSSPPRRPSGGASPSGGFPSPLLIHVSLPCRAGVRVALNPRPAVRFVHCLAQGRWSLPAIWAGRLATRPSRPRWHEPAGLWLTGLMRPLASQSSSKDRRRSPRRPCKCSDVNLVAVWRRPRAWLRLGA